MFSCCIQHVNTCLKYAIGQKSWCNSTCYRNLGKRSLHAAYERLNATFSVSGHSKYWYMNISCACSAGQRSLEAINRHPRKSGGSSYMNSPTSSITDHGVNENPHATATSSRILAVWSLRIKRS